MIEAACKAFYPDWHRLENETAASICKHCPLKEECLKMALEESWWLRYNTWAGIHFHGLRCQVWRNTCVMCDEEFYALSSRAICSTTCRKRRQRSPIKREQTSVPKSQRRSVLVFEDSLEPRPTAPDVNRPLPQPKERVKDEPFWMFDPNNPLVRRLKAKETANA